MSNSRWFRLPATTEPGRGKVPDTLGVDVRGYSGGDEQGNTFLVRVYADTATLDELANKPRAVDFSNVPRQAINAMTGKGMSEEEIQQSFKVEQ